MARVVTEMVRADYEGDRAALANLREQLHPPPDDSRLASLVFYWRGFAMWRRSINGLNDGVEPTELDHDLQAAVSEFQSALSLAPDLLDARVGLMSSLGYEAYLGKADVDAMLPSLARILATAVEALIDEPRQPRLLWALGPTLWFSPRGSPMAVVEARQARAMRTYERALEFARAERRRGIRDPLTPHWGEPELLANLAWSNLHRVKPDLAVAETQARAALALVPHWHYVRDVLLPQIAKAKRSSSQAEGASRGATTHESTP